MIVIMPIAARSNNRPAPGQPPGKLENKRCSLWLLGIRWCSNTLQLKSSGGNGKANPQGSEFFDTTIEVLFSGDTIQMCSFHTVCNCRPIVISCRAVHSDCHSSLVLGPPDNSGFSPSQLDDSAPYAYRHRLRAVTGTQLLHD